MIGFPDVYRGQQTREKSNLFLKKVAEAEPERKERESWRRRAFM
jgi:hypothetical protein